MHVTSDPAVLSFGTPLLLVSSLNEDGLVAGPELPARLRGAARRGHLIALQLRALQVHVEAAIRRSGQQDRIDPDRWRRLIMSFCQCYGPGDRLRHSTLVEIPESAYRPAGCRPAEARLPAAG